MAIFFNFSSISEAVSFAKVGDSSIRESCLNLFINHGSFFRKKARTKGLLWCYGKDFNCEKLEFSRLKILQASSASKEANRRGWISLLKRLGFLIL